MAKEGFEQDLDEYLKVRKGSGFDIRGLFNKFIKKKTPIVELPEQVEVYHKRDDVKETAKESVFSKFFKRQNDELVQVRMLADDAVSDICEMSKIALDVVRQLPDEKLREFRSSENFERLKSLLKKHNLIK